MSSPWTDEELEYLKKCGNETNSKSDAARKFIETYSRGFNGARVKLSELELNPAPPKKTEIKDPVKIEEKTQIARLRDEISSLRSDLKEAYKLAHTDQKLVEIIQEIKGKKFDQTPSWVCKKRKTSIHGIPTLDCSDWHLDEFVFKDQVNGLNAFDHEIGFQRVDHLFYKFLDIYLNTYSKPDYDGLHLMFNGDIVGGNIHEELRETNAQPILKTVYDSVNSISKNIRECKKEFKKIFITWSVGNHGRLDKKPRAKNRVFDNYEWIIGQFVAKQFEDDPDITFLIPDAAEFTFEIYNTRFLQLHGDAFRGGSGIGGILVPILRGFAKKSQTYAAVHKPVDVMLIGHFHQYIHLSNLVINGTLKGVDEYSLLMGFPYEKPQQASWINHPEHGMIHRTPIICNGGVK